MLHAVLYQHLVWTHLDTETGAAGGPRYRRVQLSSRIGFSSRVVGEMCLFVARVVVEVVFVGAGSDVPWSRRRGNGDSFRPATICSREADQGNTDRTTQEDSALLIARLSLPFHKHTSALYCAVAGNSSPARLQRSEEGLVSLANSPTSACASGRRHDSPTSDARRPLISRHPLPPQHSRSRRTSRQPTARRPARHDPFTSLDLSHHPLLGATPFHINLLRQGRAGRDYATALEPRCR